MSAPSPEKLRRARERGHVPVAHRASVVASLACALALVETCARATQRAFREGFSRAVRAASSDAPAVGDALSGAASGALRASAWALGAALLGLALTHAAQTRFLFVARAEEGDASWRPHLAEALAGASWALVLGAAGAWSAWSVACEAGVTPRARADVAGVFAAVLRGAAWRTLAVAAGLAVVELLWRRARHFEAMRPTRAEEQREAREQHGDPAVRAERQRRRRA